MWKIHKERLAINIMRWHFSQLIWNRPACWEKSKRMLIKQEEINFIITTQEYCGSSPQPAHQQQLTHLEKDQLIWKKNKD